MRATAALRWDVVDEHLDEAIFLHGLWEQSLVDPGYVLDEVAVGPEARLLAHLDGLVVAGDAAAEKTLLPQLAESEAGAVFASSFALLASEGGDFTAPVLAVLSAGSPGQRAAVVRALELVERDELREKLAEILASGEPLAQAAALEVYTRRRWAPDVPLPALASAAEPELRCAALRAARCFPRLLAPTAIDKALRSDDAVERNTALTTGLILGLPAASAAGADLVKGSAAGWEVPAVLHALTSPSPTGPLAAALGDPARVKAAVLALGFAGRVEAVESIMPLLREKTVAKVAGEAFWALTGLAIEADYMLADDEDEPPGENAHGERRAGGGQGPAPGSAEERDGEGDGGSDGERDPDGHLPTPNPDAVGAWWKQAKDRFDPNLRWLAGRPWSMDGLVSALVSGGMRRRHAYALDLAIRTGGSRLVDAGAPTARQRQQLASLERQGTTTPHA